MVYECGDVLEHLGITYCCTGLLGHHGEHSVYVLPHGVLRWRRDPTLVVTGCKPSTDPPQPALPLPDREAIEQAVAMGRSTAWIMSAHGVTYRELWLIKTSMAG